MGKRKSLNGAKAANGQSDGSGSDEVSMHLGLEYSISLTLRRTSIC